VQELIDRGTLERAWAHVLSWLCLCQRRMKL